MYASRETISHPQDTDSEVAVGGHPHSTNEWMNQFEDLEGDMKWSDIPGQKGSDQFRGQMPLWYLPTPLKERADLYPNPFWPHATGTD